MEPNENITTMAARAPVSSLRGALMVLEMLTERLPPPEGQNHGLAVFDGGLKIVVRLAGNRWQSIELEDADLDKDSDQIVDDTLTILAAMQATGG